MSLRPTKLGKRKVNPSINFWVSNKECIANILCHLDIFQTLSCIPLINKRFQLLLTNKSNPHFKQCFNDSCRDSSSEMLVELYKHYPDIARGLKKVNMSISATRLLTDIDCESIPRFPFLERVWWENEWSDLDPLDAFYPLVTHGWKSVSHTVTVCISFVQQLYMRDILDNQLKSLLPKTYPLIPRILHLTLTSSCSHTQRGPPLNKDLFIWFLNQTQPQTLIIDEYLVSAFTQRTIEPFEEETYDALQSFSSQCPSASDLYVALSCFPNLQSLNVDWGCNETLELSVIGKLCTKISTIDCDVNQLKEFAEKKVLLSSLWKDLKTTRLAVFNKINDLSIVSSSLDFCTTIHFSDSQDPEMLLHLTPIPSVVDITITLDSSWLLGVAALYGREAKQKPCPFPNAQKIDVFFDQSTTKYLVNIQDYVGVFHYILRLCPNIKVLELTLFGSPWELLDTKPTVVCDDLNPFPCLKEMRIIIDSRVLWTTLRPTIAYKEQTLILPPNVPKCWIHKTEDVENFALERLKVKSGSKLMVLNREYVATSHVLWEVK